MKELLESSFVAPLQTSPSCCMAFKDLRTILDWTEIGDNSGFYHKPSLGSHGWKVNYCPSCGKPVSDYLWRKSVNG